MNKFPLSSLYNFRSFWIFLKNYRDICSSRCTTGVHDTGGKWKKSSIRIVLINTGQFFQAWSKKISWHCPFNVAFDGGCFKPAPPPPSPCNRGRISICCTSLCTRGRNFACVSWQGGMWMEEFLLRRHHAWLFYKYVNKFPKSLYLFKSCFQACNISSPSLSSKKVELLSQLFSFPGMSVSPLMHKCTYYCLMSYSVVSIDPYSTF